MVGKTLGHYEITGQLGRGGMGEVWRARDKKLGREVAIKTLPNEFSQDRDRLERFEREARLLAALNHPNVAAIYGLEEAEGKRFLVLELVEGETLAERLHRGALSADESLKLGLQITEALEAAHDKGVIHRDLKPANVKVTPEGKVKVLDFGLAKAYAGDANLNLSNSPTLSMAATQQGVILGTAAYMSPEQARGIPVDKRADIWALGCVLYKMLTGRQAFEGEMISDVMASVLAREPDFDRLDAKLHPKIRDLLKRCLEKDASNRWQDAGDIRFEIRQALADPSRTIIQHVETTQPSSRSRVAGVGVATFVVGSLIAATFVWFVFGSGQPTEPIVTRFPLTLPESDTVNLNGGMAFSPTGDRIAYIALRDAAQHLFVRTRSQIEPVQIPGTEGAMHPFFSPDGEWVGFFTGSELRRVALAGGPTSLITPANDRYGATWGPDETIVFSSTDAPGLMQVSASGGEPQVLTTPENEGERHLWPEFLPGGNAVLFTISQGGPISDKEVAVLSLDTDETRVLVDGTDADYAASGQLVFAREASLWAVPFDLERLEVTGEPSPMVENVRVNSGGGWAFYATADDGSLVYLNRAFGGDDGPPRTLLWVDRQGNEEPIPADPLTYAQPRLSPDGGRIALDTRGGSDDLWIWDFSLQTLSRFAFDDEEGRYPVWTADGEEIVYSGSGSFLRKVSDNSEPAVPIDSDQVGAAYFLSDGEDRLVFQSPGNLQDISMISLEGDSEPEPLLEGAFRERNAALSPDGKWMAYQSDESGQYEIYVRPFPEVEGSRSPISNAGGFSPVWSADGEELFYIEPGPPARLMSAAVELDPAFALTGREAVIDWPYRTTNGGTGRAYDVAPDSERFIAIRNGTGETDDVDAEPPGLTVVLNWFEELRERVPVP